MSDQSAESSVFSSGSGRRYELERKLGSGGFGSVWLGYLVGARGFSKQVAIKVLNTGDGSDGPESAEMAMRLRDEARLLGLLRHRAIVHVEDLVRIEGRWAVVMEYISGADLQELLALGPIPPRPLCEIVTEVTSALRVAHEAKNPSTGEPLRIVHRDIKPANLRLSEKGEIKVLDFGVARAEFDSREAVTRSTAFGSPGYVAPERLSGLDTPAADIYALGIVFAECLLGDRVRLALVMKQHEARREEIVAQVVARVGAEAGPTLGSILGRMLAYDLEERPTAEEVEETFQNLVLTVEGPWLKRWAPTTLEALEGRRRERAERSRELIDAASVVSTPVPSQASLESGQGTLTLAQATSEAEIADPPASLAPQPEIPDTAVLVAEALPPPSAPTPPLETPAARDPAPTAPTPTTAPRAVTSPPTTAPLFQTLSGAEAPRGARFPAALVVIGLVLAGAASWLWMRSPVPTPQSLESAPSPVNNEVRLAQPRPEDAGSSQTATPTPPVEASSARPAAARTGAPTAKPAVAAKSSKEATTPASDAELTAPGPTTPASANTPDTATGVILIKGDFREINLVDAQGRSYKPGQLPVGAYTLRVTFDSGVTVAREGINVVAGDTLTLRCSGRTESCR